MRANIQVLQLTGIRVKGWIGQKQVLTAVKESMEEALERIVPEVRFVAEIEVAEDWG